MKSKTYYFVKEKGDIVPLKHWCLKHGRIYSTITSRLWARGSKSLSDSGMIILDPARCIEDKRVLS